jgi:hypothetical protein
MRPRLSVYRGPQTASNDTSYDTRTVSVAEVLPLLADAILNNRTWLDDFADDEITLSADLHDVLLAYRHLRRPTA